MVSTLSIHDIIGSDDTIAWWQMVIRAAAIFVVAVVLVRFGGKRIFGRNTAFDIVLAVMLGSILSRALTANAPFFPTIAAAVALVLLHILLAKLSFRSRRIGYVIKGQETQLVANGEILWDAMRKSGVTAHDLIESLRTTAKHADIGRVHAAFLERSGKISFLE